MESVKEVTITDAIYEKVYEGQVNQLKKMLQRRALAAFKKANSGINGAKVRLTSQLHLPYFLEPDLALSDTRTLLSKKLLSALIQELYGNEEFYKSAIAKNGYILETTIDLLFKKIDELKKKKRFQDKEQLATILFDTPLQQELFYNMLKGTKPKDAMFQESSNERGFPSLLHFLSVEKKDVIISLYLAPVAVLNILIPDQNKVKELINERTQIYLEIQRAKQKKYISASQAKTEQISEDDDDPDFHDDIADDASDTELDFTRFEERLRAKYAKTLRTDIEQNMIGYQVSGTDPRKNS